MASGKKIADGAQKMSTGPFITWLRSVFLRHRRVDKYQDKIMRDEFVNQQRFPADQSARSQPPPNVPGGIHHRLAQNYYSEHDARRAVEPPKLIPLADKALISGGAAKHLQVAIGPQVSLGPAVNFGLPPQIPVPGTGHEWRRNPDEELPTQQNDEEFVPLERYDSYRQAASQ